MTTQAAPAPAKETLFTLAGDLLALDDLLTESGGELTPEVEALLAQYEAKFTSKVDGLGWYWRTIEARIAGFKKAADELTAKRRTEENKLARLKGYVELCLAHLGTRKAEGQLYTLSIQKNGGKLPIELMEPFKSQPELLPSNLQLVTVHPDMDAIRAAAERDGFEFEDIARILPAGESIRLR